MKARVYVTTLLALAALIAPTATLFAQARSDQGRVQGGRAETCQARAGGSRMRSNNCENEAPPQTARAEHEVTVRLELPASIGPQCEASALTEYSQRGARALVSGTISIGSCPVGTSGAFTLVARVRDESGEVKLLEFNETWQRDDAQDVKFNGDYAIGDNIELVNVRLRNLTCTCAAPAAPEASALEAAPPN
jgi:hypothetical protein